MSIEKAIEKIKTEMQKDPNNTYLEIIGHYVIDRCIDEQAAEKLLADNKTLDGAMSAIRSKAQKNKKGNCGVMRDVDIIIAVDNYFALSHNEQAQAACIQAVDGGITLGGTGQAAGHKAPCPTALNLDFDSFL